MDNDLLDDDELARDIAEADRILEQPAKQYTYRTEYRGGPRNLSEQEMYSAAIELTTARVLLEEIEDRAHEARVQLYQIIEEQLENGVPVEFVAEHSGLKHRNSVYRAVKKLPQMTAQYMAARRLRSKLTEGKSE